MPKLVWIHRPAVVTLLAVITACGPGRTAQAQQQEEADEPVRSRIEESLGGLPTALDTATAARLSGAFRAAAAKALPAVVFVQVTQERSRGEESQRFFPFFQDPRGERERPPQVGRGSGFIFDAQGYIMTNAHVVRDADRVTVRLIDGREFDAEVIGTDPNTDVAVIRIDPPDGDRLPVAQFGNSERLRVGDWVLALGNPLGQLDFSVTAGIVSAKGRSLGILQRNEGASAALEAFIQTDAAINPGNSGGPLVDLLGRIVGVNTAIASPTGVFSGAGFAIPINLADRIANDLIEYGTVRRPRLGVMIEDVDAVDAEVYGLSAVRGAEIRAVQAGTPAADAGLQAGDVIIEIDGEPINDATELQTLLAQHTPGETITLVIVRDRERTRVDVELGEFEVSEPREQAQEERTSTAELLGFRITPLTSERAARLDIGVDRGVLVAEVRRFSPAQQAGVRRGQVITAMNGEQVAAAEDVERIADALDPGDVVSLVVRDPRAPEVGEMVINYRTRR